MKTSPISLDALSVLSKTPTPSWSTTCSPWNLFASWRENSFMMWVGDANWRPIIKHLLKLYTNKDKKITWCNFQQGQCWGCMFVMWNVYESFKSVGWCQNKTQVYGWMGWGEMEKEEFWPESLGSERAQVLQNQMTLPPQCPLHERIR